MIKSADGSQRILSLNGSYPGGFDYVAINAEIGSTNRNGTIYIHWIVQNTDASYPLTKVNCSTLPAP
jgi:hypothetical protein